MDTQILPRTEAEKLFGFELYQGGVPPGKWIRVVRVGSDIEACAGTHVTNTGMIGAIKILRTERIQDGVERIEFAAGEAAVRAVQERDNLLSVAADALHVSIEQLPKTAARFFEEWKSQKKEIEHTKEEFLDVKPCDKRIDHEDSLEKLATIAKGDTNPVCRALALRVLAESKKGDAIDPIFQIICRDKSEYIKRMCAGPALISLGSELLLEPMIKKLVSPDKTERLNALDVLGKLGDAKAINAIKELANKADEDRGIRGKAKEILSRGFRVKI